MASRFTDLCIDCHDLEGQAAFWCAVLGYEVGERHGDEVELVGPPGSGPRLTLVTVPESKIIKNRVHMDLRASDRDQEAELARLLELGAKQVDVGQGDPTWFVLADPEGNEFCLLRRRVPAEGALPVEPLPEAD